MLCHAVLSNPQFSLVLPVTLTTGEAGALLKDGDTGFQAGVLPKLALLGPPLGCYTASFQALFHSTGAGCQAMFTKDTWAIASRKLFQSSKDQMQRSTEPDFPKFLHALSLLISSNFEPGPKWPQQAPDPQRWRPGPRGAPSTTCGHGWAQPHSPTWPRAVLFVVKVKQRQQNGPR